MNRWLRRLAKTLLLLLVLAAPAYYLLAMHSPTPTAPPYRIDMAELRMLANSMPGAKPTEVRYEHVMDFVFAEAMVVAGEPWRQTLLPVYSFQLLFPDRSLILDTAMPRAMAKPDRMVPAYHEDAYQRMLSSMDKAAQIVLTHEHMDHIGGLAAHPRLEALLPAVKLNEEQFAHPERMRPAELPATLFAEYRPLRYEQALAIAPGVVLLKAPGHTPGSQMVYVQRADGRELLFLGDVAWHQHSIDVQRERPLFMTLLIGENRQQVLAQFAALQALASAEPGVRQIPGHDGPVVQQLTQQGLLRPGFQP
jgi:glyoxylase-like metal-dependent hydrolase (beta-lactamase superfamily II)